MIYYLCFLAFEPNFKCTVDGGDALDELLQAMRSPEHVVIQAFATKEERDDTYGE